MPSLQSALLVHAAPQTFFTQYVFVGGGKQATGFSVQKHVPKLQLLAVELFIVVLSFILSESYSVSFNPVQ
jgi:hypothetical protein